MREDPESAGREALLECYLRTSESAFRRRPYRDVPVKRGSAILHVSGEDFCACTTHSVPPEAFHSIPDGYKKLVLQHFSSRWLDESCACIRQMHQRLLAQSDAPWDRTAAVVREFFEFHPPNTPLRFQSWIGSALATEVAWLDERMALGLPSHGPLDEWEAIAASVAAVFERQLEITLDELRPDSPLDTSSADSVEPDSKVPIHHASRGGRPRKDDERRRVLELRDQKKSWGEVTIQMNKETGQTKSQHAYRMLVSKKKA
jgi:hypothetical protein